MKARIESLFSILDCEAENDQELLGTQGVTEGNMMKYLGLIEMRVTELL